jgi:hypothetical protein
MKQKKRIAKLIDTISNDEVSYREAIDIVCTVLNVSIAISTHKNTGEFVGSKKDLIQWLEDISNTKPIFYIFPN